MMHTSDCDKSVFPLSSQEPTPLVNSTQINKTQFPNLREPNLLEKLILMIFEKFRKFALIQMD